MNKLLIIFLAVCLISVHAYVKRDAEAAPNGGLLDDFKKQADEIWEKMQKGMQPDKVKKDFSDLVDNVSKIVNSMKPNAEPPK